MEDQGKTKGLTPLRPGEALGERLSGRLDNHAMAKTPRTNWMAGSFVVLSVVEP